MRADDLILFTQVVDLGSFTRVAEQNNLTNSVVSKRIGKLEDELGIQLLYRTTRKLSLTEAGETLYQGAKNVKLATEAVQEAVLDLGQSMTGHIKMSVPTISGDLVLADAVAEFCSMHPGLTVDMSLNNRFVDLIEDGYDLVVRTGHLEDSTLIARHLIDSQWVVCASPKYIAQHGRPLLPQDLLEHNCLLYAYQATGAADWQFKDGDRHYILRISGNFSTDTAGALRKAALGGYGVAYVPRCLVYHDIQKGDLVDLLPDQVGKRLGIYAVYPYSRHPLKKVTKLIEHIKHRYSQIGDYF
ncbi:LysR family transcriptional regulator [Vibrio astriarenae]|uniref:LysR family transcriptional regulator n=1 Tax=Vibrio astriarenae TaxID=1481923 RepID=A0A7Z2T7W7_9VIBR|nr:LysR family transcriptional regulator [Vibrio astriarenae]QIA65905.1 LysR family transcriptional regulator [Vibrio astriarenae]